MEKILIKNLQEMKGFAAKIAKSCKKGDVIGLKGTLGTGKSFFASSFINALSDKPVEVPSPTFNIVYSYPTKSGEVYHFDLYRIKDENELENIGIYDAFDVGISLIEWPEVAQGILGRNYTEIEIKIGDEEGERIVFVSRSPTTP